MVNVVCANVIACVPLLSFSLTPFRKSRPRKCQCQREWHLRLFRQRTKWHSTLVWLFDYRSFQCECRVKQQCVSSEQHKRMVDRNTRLLRTGFIAVENSFSNPIIPVPDNVRGFATLSHQLIFRFSITEKNSDCYTFPHSKHVAVILGSQLFDFAK